MMITMVNPGSSQIGCQARKTRKYGVSIVILLLFGLIVSSQAQIRASQIGSNPYLSAELFPQDLSQLPVSGFIYSPTYVKLPYWGRIDDPQIRPNGNYTSTGLTNDNFSHTAKIYSITNDIGLTHSFSPQTFVLMGLNLDLDARYNGAIGTLHGRDSLGNIISTLPFDYSMLHALGTGKFDGAAAFSIKGIAFGVHLQLGLQNTAVLNHSLSFTKDDTSYNSDRATWGWTTSPCAHVFGLKGPEGDTWLQNDYAIGPLYSINVTAGATLPFGKSGLQLSTISGHQDYYEWQPDSNAFGNDTIINRNFIGHYEKQPWNRTTRGLLLQVYTNHILNSNDHYALGLFGRAGYNGITYGQALSGNENVTRDEKQSQRGFSIDMAPNLTIPFQSIFSYIDVAIPVQYGYTRKNNTYMRWVGGGQIRTYWETHTSNTDENTWEPFSYANQNDLGIGVDFSTMFPLINMPACHLGLGLQLLINASATFTDKNYGENTDNGSSVDFTVKQKRHDYEGRKQFSTGVKLQYQGSRSFVWFEITEPLLQAVRPITKVTDVSGQNVFYEHEKEPLWLSMQGIRFSLYYTYNVVVPWLDKFNVH